MGKLVGGVTDFLGLTDIKGTQDRANQAAAQQKKAAQLAQFRPIGITTNLGSSSFDYLLNKPLKRKANETDEEFAQRQLMAERTQGTLAGAGYELSPELKAIQDQLFGLTGGALETAQGAADAAKPLGIGAQSLFNLASQYLGESPEAVRQRYMQQQQALLDMPRQAEEARLASSVFGRGRAGLNVGTSGQPELTSLAMARRQQDLALAAAAEQAAQQQIQFGQGLFGAGAGLLTQQYGLPSAALAPLQSYLGTIGSVEEMGQQPFKLSLALAGGQQPGQSAAANLLANAAQTQFVGGQMASNQLTGLMKDVFTSAVKGFNPSSFMGGGGGGSAASYGGQPWGGTVDNPWYG